MNVQDSAVIDISHTTSRQIEWNVASATITGTIQWTGQAAKAITGAITYRETLNNRYFYDWTYDSDDRPTAPVAGVINLTDSTTSVSIPVEFVEQSVVKVPRAASAITAGGSATRTKVSATETTLVESLS